MPRPKERPRRLLAFDTETNGLDFRHGTRPFMAMIAESATACDRPEVTIWKWRVCPYTRAVTIPRRDLLRIRQRILRADEIVGHNLGFDVHALTYVFEDADIEMEWPWDRMHDTMSSAHLLGSTETKNLTDQTLRWLGIDVTPLEKAIKTATVSARSITSLKAFEDSTGKLWDKAGKDREDMPSAGEDPWKADMFFPSELVHAVIDGRVDAKWLPKTGGWTSKNDPTEHPWLTKVDEYAGADAVTTYHLYKAHLKEIRRRGLTKIYNARRGVAEVAHRLECDGLTLDSERRGKLRGEYKRETLELSKTAAKLANRPDFKRLPRGTTNQLKTIVFKDFGLKPHKPTNSGNPDCMDKEVIGKWLEDLDPDSDAYQFIEALKEFRQRTTAISYFDGYRRFWTHVEGTTYRLHPSLNSFGTRTLRSSSSNPNEQNISKKKGFNLRRAFGPQPGRAWAALDYENQELRLPAYESGEASLVNLFEDPTAPPYFGSNHLLNFETVYPDLWEEARRITGHVDKIADYIKEGPWSSTWYRRCKNGGFAVQYGSINSTSDTQWSTADRSFGRKGCHTLLESRFSALGNLNQWCIEQANATGFVDTMPDKTVDPTRGYPLQCERDEYGRVSPTQPFNTRVQGTACWITTRAMEGVMRFFDDYNHHHDYDDEGAGRGWFVTANVHDEIVVDFPLTFPTGRPEPFKGVLLEVSSIMEKAGEGVGVPMKVGCDTHMNNWGD